MSEYPQSLAQHCYCAAVPVSVAPPPLHGPAVRNTKTSARPRLMMAAPRSRPRDTLLYTMCTDIGGDKHGGGTHVGEGGSIAVVKTS